MLFEVVLLNALRYEQLYLKEYLTSVNFLLGSLKVVKPILFQDSSILDYSEQLVKIVVETRDLDVHILIMYYGLHR